jgi:hypothetical protein
MRPPVSASSRNKPRPDSLGLTIAWIWVLPKGYAIRLARAVRSSGVFRISASWPRERMMAMAAGDGRPALHLGAERHSGWLTELAEPRSKRRSGAGRSRVLSRIWAQARMKLD